MAKRRRIKVVGTQRKEIDPDLMAQLIVVLGKQLWAEHQAGKAGRRPGSRTRTGRKETSS